MSIVALKEMFEKMVIQKNASLISHYYHKEFRLYTNGREWDYDRFHAMHEEIYQTQIQYQVRYDEPTLLESDNKVAGRLWITTSRPNESPKELELILIAHYKERKLYRLWELTYPDWSQLPAFEEKS